MTLSILQCFECNYSKTLKRVFKNKKDMYICSQYSEEGIPETVEMGTKDCPKFEEEK